ncbi:MAG: hypothetical protein IT204_08165 [Fimbriimonadaceae bacterium]|nr:hypothetical protein [Fimbriimonadaceae bacterium]
MPAAADLAQVAVGPRAWAVLRDAELLVGPPPSDQWRPQRRAAAADCRLPTWDRRGRLWVARGGELLRWTGRWEVIDRRGAPILQILPGPGGLVLLSGYAADPAPVRSRVWWLPDGGRASAIGGIPPTWRTWRLGWAAHPDGVRLTACVHKATRYWRVPHHGYFVFLWRSGRVEPCWLGSRLARPYLAAVHATLRPGRADRLVSLEVDGAGERRVAVYRPIGFGYEHEWDSPPVPGGSDLHSGGNWVLLQGLTAVPWVRGLTWDGQQYRLGEPQPEPAPPAAQAALPDGRLVAFTSPGWVTLVLSGPSGGNR